ncbi:MAG: hypothetical protein IBJ07_20715 [Rhizobiaceae bacterium]|nr:hypothetical protein [Rhizobiaceae bacterium]
MDRWHGFARRGGGFLIAAFQHAKDAPFGFGEFGAFGFKIGDRLRMIDAERIAGNGVGLFGAKLQNLIFDVEAALADVGKLIAERAGLLFLDRFEAIPPIQHRAGEFHRRALHFGRDGRSDGLELPVDLIGAADHAFVQHKAKAVRFLDLATDAVRALIDKLDKSFAGRAAEEFVGHADLRRPVQLLHSPDDLDQQIGRLLQLRAQERGRQTKPIEGFRAAALAGDDKLVGAKIEFLQAIRERVNGNPVLVGDKGQFLKRAHVNAGTLRRAADVRHAFRDLADLADDLIEAGDSQAARDTTGEAKAEVLQDRADTRRRCRHGLFHPVAGLFRSALDPGELVARRAAGLMHVALKVADARFKRDDKAFGIINHRCSYAARRSSNSSSARS